MRSDELLMAAIRKSEIYYSIGDERQDNPVPFDGHYAEQLRQAYAEWKAAETEYTEFCIRLKAN